MTYNTYDLLDIAEFLGPAFNPRTASEYTARCETCAEEIAQTDDECSSCQTPTIWFNSHTWKRLYGSPQTRLRILSMPLPDDDDQIAKELLDRLGMAGFATLTQKKRWSRARKKIEDSRLQSMITAVIEQHKNKRAVLPHLLNWMDKVAREADSKPSKKPQQGIPTIPRGY